MTLADQTELTVFSYRVCTTSKTDKKRWNFRVVSKESPSAGGARPSVSQQVKAGTSVYRGVQTDLFLIELNMMRLQNNLSCQAYYHPVLH